MLKKFKKPEEEATTIVEKIVEQSVVIDLKPEHTAKALELKRNYNLSWFDALIVTTALDASCNILYSKNMQHELVINDRLRIINPFLSSMKYFIHSFF